MKLDNIYIAKLPILNTNQEIMGYELLFRTEAVQETDVEDGTLATARVIVNAVNNYDIQKMLESVIGFVHVNDKIIKKGMLRSLRKEKFLFEIMDSTIIDPEVVTEVAAMKQEGYLFGLDSFVFTDNRISYFEPLFPYISVVKTDLKKNPETQIQERMGIFEDYPVQFLAEKVESVEQFKLFKNLGFQLFQGYFFSRPVIIRGRNIDPGKLAIMELINLIYQDSDIQVLEKTFKNFPELTLNLLQFINSAAIARRNRISSVKQALALLGHKQLLNWLIMMGYAVSNTGYSGNPLLYTALERAKTMELICAKLSDNDSIKMDEAFLIGLLSLLDALFQAPMDQILNSLNLSDDIVSAILKNNGLLGKLLLLLQKMEQDSYQEVLFILSNLNLSLSDLNKLSLEGFNWAQTNARLFSSGKDDVKS